MVTRVAVIGAGRRGHTHTEAVADLEGVAQVVGVADIDASRAQELVSASAPHGKAYTDARAMLREVQPEIVYITTPPPLHKEQALAAFEAGANVVIEKPIALSIEAAEAIGEAAERAGRLVHICHQMRYNEGMAEMRALLSNQPIALTHIWNYRKGPDIPGNWNRAWGGGHVVEWGIHYLDVCRSVMSTEAVEVYARYTDQVLRGQPTWDNWDGYSLTVQWANGAVGSYASTYALKPGLPGASGLTIIAADGQATFSWDGSTWTTPEGEQTWGAGARSGERGLARAFVAATNGDKDAILQPYDDAMKTHRLVLAANESAITGKPVKL
jgi:predicted dehydrogenase